MTSFFFKVLQSCGFKCSQMGWFPSKTSSMEEIALSSPRKLSDRVFGIHFNPQKRSSWFRFSAKIFFIKFIVFFALIYVWNIFFGTSILDPGFVFWVDIAFMIFIDTPVVYMLGKGENRFVIVGKGVEAYYVGSSDKKRAFFSSDTTWIEEKPLATGMYWLPSNYRVVMYLDKTVSLKHNGQNFCLQISVPAPLRAYFHQCEEAFIAQGILMENVLAESTINRIWNNDIRKAEVAVKEKIFNITDKNFIAAIMSEIFSSEKDENGENTFLKERLETFATSCHVKIELTTSRT